MKEFLESCFASIYERRARDIPYRDSISIPTALAVLRQETKLTREELSERLRINPSKLAYIEQVGNPNETQLYILIGIATEYSMANLAHYFESKRLIYKSTHRGRGNFKVI